MPLTRSKTLAKIKPSTLFGLHHGNNGFAADVRGYFSALASTPANFVRRAVRVHDFKNTVASLHDEQKGEMVRTLNWFDVMNLGIGIMLGAGVFVVTGTVANEYAGGATVMSYFIAGVSALLSSLCFSEYAVEMPVAGGSFTFILHTFGEFWAWLTATNLLMNYVLANAAVARAFLTYFSSLCNQGANFLYVRSGGQQLDFVAFGLVLVLTVLLMWGMKETKTVNNIITVVHLAVVVFIIIAGLSQAEASNFTAGGWAPFGVRGVWNGAAIVFFSYVGFDAIATTAEEVKNPGVNIPIGMTLAMIIVTFLYLMCSVALTLMLPYTRISPSAAFSQAFRDIGMDWAAYVVAIGALMGIVTGVMVGMVAVARACCALGRERYLPPIFGVVSQKRGTPIFATAILGFVTAMIALFTSFNSLINLVSVCTLSTFTFVACGILWRHYHVPGVTKPWIAGAILFWNVATSVALAVYYNLSNGYIGLVVPGGLWILGAVVITFVPQAYKPAGFSVPLMPWIPSGSIMLNTFLMGTLGKQAYVQWGIFMAIVTGVYFVYSLPNMVIMEGNEAGKVPAAEPSIEDGVEVEGGKVLKV